MKEALAEQSTLLSAPLPPDQNPLVRQRDIGVKRSAAVSPAKVKANQKNALRSTGPRTQRGKRIASENALKHGFFCKELLIAAGDGQESKEELELLLHDLITEFQPQGCIEYMLVEEIAASAWRLRRVHKFETAEIRKQADNAKARLFLDREEQFSRLESNLKTMASMFPTGTGDARRALLRTTAGVDLMIGKLEAFKAFVEKDGCVSEQLEEWFCAYLGDDERFKLISSAARDAHASKATVGGGVGQPKEAMLAWFDDQLKAHRARRKMLADCDKSEAEAHVATLLVPSADTVDKITRYEDNLLGRLYRALDRLERNQRRRRDEHARLRSQPI